VYVFPLRVPPLRERKEDMAELIAHFASQIASQNGWKQKSFDEHAVEELRQYSWPGNIRELRNVVERLILLSEGDTVNGDHVRLVLPSYASTTGDAGPGAGANHHAGSSTLAERSEMFERETLISEIRRQNFHMTNVARALGLERSHLYKKCQQLGIDLQAIRKPA
jgi:two-component system nitrogen regulation response regulator NtrX